MQIVVEAVSSPLSPPFPPPPPPPFPTVLYHCSQTNVFCWHAVTARSTLLAPVCSGPASDHITIWRQHNLAVAHSAAIPILVSVLRGTYPQPTCLKFVVMAEDEEGLCAKDWYRFCPAITRPEMGSRGGEPTPHNTLPADEGIVVHSCGLLLTDAFHHQVAVWQFPSFPD